jgi:hypothetical protein
MVLAAAGLSSVHAADFCNTDTTFERASAVDRTLSLWPPGLKCTSAAATKESGDVVGFLAILAAGLILLFVRRSSLALTTAFVFGVAGLTQVPLGLVPALGFGWLIGGYLGFSRTGSTPATLTAVAALGVGALLDVVGAGPAGWVIVLLALIAVPTPYEEQ